MDDDLPLTNMINKPPGATTQIKQRYDSGLEGKNN